MAQKITKLSPAQQKIINLLEQGCVGRFWTKSYYAVSNYTYAELVQASESDQGFHRVAVVKMPTVRALARKDLVTITEPTPAAVGFFRGN